MRSRRPLAAALTAVAALVGLPALEAAPAAGVTVRQSYPVPSGGTFTLRGHGFGHGHGMSQYGAYGAARQKLGYRAIIGFYYPGTSWSTARGWLRVRITADTSRDVVVDRADGLRVYDLGSRTTYPLPTDLGATRWRLNVSGTRTVVGYYASGWHRYRPGGLAALAGDGQLSADEPLTLRTPTGARTYRGALRAASPQPGSSDRDTVNVLRMDSYVKGVLPAEMPTSWPIEAVKSQAVAARTYATWSRAQNPSRYWHICDTTACQVYRGTAPETTRGNAAVDATAKQILTYQRAAAFTQFSSSSGGRLSAGSRPYLVAKADPYDDHSANPVHDWTLRLSAKRVQGAYPKLGRLKRLLVTRREGGGEWGGRVLTVVLDGAKRDVTLSGADFRSRFGLRSTWFRG